jgi:hypothetical protein
MKKSLLLLSCCFLVIAAFAQTKSVAENLAQQQLDAYNNRDIEAFLLPYSDSVEVYQFSNKLLYKGKETMRSQYKDMFADTKDLHCTLVKRIVLGNKVIDEESVLFNTSKPPFRAIAIYIIENNKIAKVYFMQ